MSSWVDAPTSPIVRRPVVAGSFYPDAPDRLRSVVGDLFIVAAGVPPATGNVHGKPPIGLLVPHAGLVYSGVTAAVAWSQLLPGDAAAPPTIVILGTNHGAAWLDGIGAWDSGVWRTPLGDVGVDNDLARAIVELGPPFSVDLEAHDMEHSIEVQLPLLQTVSPHARIVPLAVSCGRGPRAVETGARLGELLRRRREQGADVVIVVSTDMAHYPPAPSCERATRALLPSIVAVDAPGLADREASVRIAGGRGLSCGMCGIEPAVLGLAALRSMGAGRGTILATATSADAGGPADRTVGYLAARFDA